MVGLVRGNASLDEERYTHRKTGLGCVTLSVFRLFGPVKNAIRGRKLKDEKVINQGRWDVHSTDYKAFTNKKYGLRTVGNYWDYVEK